MRFPDNGTQQIEENESREEKDRDFPEFFDHGPDETEKQCQPGKPLFYRFIAVKFMLINFERFH